MWGRHKEQDNFPLVGNIALIELAPTASQVLEQTVIALNHLAYNAFPNATGNEKNSNESCRSDDDQAFRLRVGNQYESMTMLGESMKDE